MHFINKGRNRMDFSSVIDLVLWKLFQSVTESLITLMFLDLQKIMHLCKHFFTHELTFAVFYYIKEVLHY